eukprot:6211385-Pleurochrysis_carterae.AAC.4
MITGSSTVSSQNHSDGSSLERAAWLKAYNNSRECKNGGLHAANKDHGRRALKQLFLGYRMRKQSTLDVGCSAITKRLLFRREETTTLLKIYKVYYYIAAVVLVVVAVLCLPRNSESWRFEPATLFITTFANE